MSERKEPLYIQLYNYYKGLILLGTLAPGSKLPSIRRCASERMVSRITVEAAYLQLAAEGYIVAKPGSGYYVGKINYSPFSYATPLLQKNKRESVKPLYDFVSSTVDYKSFNFDLWRRYIKSALRNTQRLLGYGEAQGEYDLRVALTHYIRERRGVVCTPEQIVVGAGVQSLLHILCSLVETPSSLCFVGSEFAQGKAIFEDRGIRTFATKGLNLEELLAKKLQFIYTSPSHLTPWGEVMPMEMRLALLAFAHREDCLIIEDDYDSEFRYYARPVPSLQGLDGGKKVIYLGSFSKLLLPSLRMSFMVLPLGLIESYQQKGHVYNQTASTAEQIALCQFIRDGHLEKQIKKARKLYMSKNQLLCKTIEKVFGDQAVALSGSGGFLVQLEVKVAYSAKELVERAQQVGVFVKPSTSEESAYPRLLLSCSGIAEEDFPEALSLLKEAFFGEK